jgi:hypothetical protein
MGKDEETEEELSAIGMMEQWNNGIKSTLVFHLVEK